MLPSPPTKRTVSKSAFDVNWKAERRSFYAAPSSNASRLAHWWIWTRRKATSETVRRRLSVKRVLAGAALVATVLFLLLRRKSTLALSSLEVERVWRWELASGRYPSRRPTMEHLPTPFGPSENPGVPRKQDGDETRFTGVGPARQYLSVQHPPSKRSRIAPLPRPVPNAAIDLDVVMDDCDFSTKRYVRDCLSSLRLNAGMNQAYQSYRNVTPSLYLTEASAADDFLVPSDISKLREAERDMSALLASDAETFASLLSIRQRFTLSSVGNPSANPHPSHATADPACDPDHPRIFHVYWAGPFTDKPYMAALSFLYTQRLSLDTPIGAEYRSTCRPQLWFWINPGSTASPDASAEQKMRATLATNPWSAPLLHSRFKENVKFQLWNTTEQLDAIPELAGWQSRSLFYSGGKVLKPKKSKKNLPLTAAPEEGTTISKEDDLTPPSSKTDYDRLAVALSDMVRFVLTFRYGGIYLDADTIFLRDWEELWGWRGAFAYRWSRMTLYNTAVLKMDRGSALGAAIFKTAAKNHLDFHPMTMASYMKDARMEELLLRVPDALFDPAWLNNEHYQLDRPAFPFFEKWEEFFEPPKEVAGIPEAVGFTGFFRGAFSYHFHNNWWRAFDPSRNYPDLGTRFAHLVEDKEGKNLPEGDLSWATVHKRTFEQYIRGEAPNAYGEWISWEEEQTERSDREWQ